MQRDNGAALQSGSPIVFTAGDRTRIEQCVLAVGQRLRDIPTVLNIVRVANEHRKYKVRTSYGYRLHSLAQGPAGVALFYDALHTSFPDAGWDEVAHAYLSLLQGSLHAEGDYAHGLFTGTAGLFFVAVLLSHDRTRYMRLAGMAADKISAGSADIYQSGDYVYPHMYSLCSGASGISASLLTGIEVMSTWGMGEEILIQQRQLLSRLIRHLTWQGIRDATRDVDAFNHWYADPTMREAQVSLCTREDTLPGYGMLNGLAGLISLLSLVSLNATAQLHQEEAIADALQHLCTQVRQGMRKGNAGWFWPQTKLTNEYHRPGPCISYAWCDGTSGIAHALWLAGQVLHDSTVSTLALECIAESARCFRRAPFAVGPSLCHGLAGLALTCCSFATATGDPTLQDDLRAMVERLLALFEDDRPFGYRVTEPEYIRYDDPWLLDGAAGVALALLAMLSPRPPLWTRAFLLA